MKKSLLVLYAMLFQFQIKAPSSLARLRPLNILVVCFRRLNPRRLEFIFDLKLVLLVFSVLLSGCLIGLEGEGRGGYRGEHRGHHDEGRRTYDRGDRHDRRD